MKIKDLIKGRDKLREYDDLKATLNSFKNVKDFFNTHKDTIGFACTEVSIDKTYMPFGVYITPSAIDAIISALDAEIKKLDEE